MALTPFRLPALTQAQPGVQSLQPELPTTTNALVEVGASSSPKASRVNVAALPEPLFRQSMGVKPTWRGPVFAPETSLLQCGRCHQNVDPITRVLIGTTPYHPRCLFCVRCNTQSAELYLTFRGHPVCLRCSRQVPELCRQSRSAKQQQHSSLWDPQRCRKCLKPLEGKIMTAMGYKWHSECFRCASCGRGFENDTTFGERDGQPFHISCARRISTTTTTTTRPTSSGQQQQQLVCLGCCRRVQGESYVTVTGCGVYHRHCLRCARCDAQIQASRFLEEAQTGRPLCVRCNARRRLSKQHSSTTTTTVTTS